VVAGYVGNVNQWKAFEIEWPRILKKHKINQPFHMTDFLARSKSHSDFNNWVGDEAEATILLQELTTLESLFPLASISCVISLAEYREVEKTHDIKQTLPPFALGARACMAYLYEQWLPFYRIPSDLMECVFEDGDFGKGKFIDVMRGDNMPAPTFKQKRDFAALQAADHLAWEHFAYAKKELANKLEPDMPRFQTLQLVPYISVQFPRSNLVELCRLRNIEPRKRAEYKN
jgi:hypothetical protein